MADNTTSKKVWLITGCSTGFGRSLARSVLHQNHHLIATSRTPSKTPDLVKEVESAGGHWLPLDVTASPQTLASTIDDALALHGRIDVLVNNAGLGANAGFEDLDPTRDFQRLLDTNLLGAIKTTQAVLPSMRANTDPSRGGTIVNMSSTSGFRGLPSMSAYCASKFALEGLSESLAAEYAPFAIRVVLVEPGLFRTDFFAGDKLDLAESMTEGMSDFYRGTATEKMMLFLAGQDGKQPGDPAKAAKRIVEFVHGEGMAEGLSDKHEGGGGLLRLPLGNAAIKGALDKVEKMRLNYEAVADMARSCDFDDGEAVDLAGLK